MSASVRSDAAEVRITRSHARSDDGERTQWATEMRRSLACAAIAALFVATGCADDERSPSFRIDERRGTVNGVGIGDPVAAMEGRFGEKQAADPYREPVVPLSVDVGESEGPSHFGLGPPFYRYERVSFFAEEDQIVGFMVVADAETASGIATGDDLDRVRDVYPRARCGEAPRGEYQHYSACVVRLGPRRVVWFGGDPVSTIMVGLRELGDVAE